MSLSTLSFTGNLTRDAELKYTQGGLAILALGVAVNVGYGDKQQVYYPRVSVFGKPAESLGKLNLTKGTAVAVTGEFVLREYENKQYPEVRAYDVQLLGKRDSAGSSQGSHVQVQPVNEAPSDFADDDIPFITCVELP